jgi:hypothetical protein
MRVSPWLLVAALAGCRPSAKVENTIPVANLQTYRTVGLRVQSTGFASQGQAMFLETAVLDKLRQKCGFEQVNRAGAWPADVTLDLNITNTGRGGGGFISNSSVATVDTLLVVTDGQTGELLGTSKIRGKSSGMIINNAPPENEAVEAVAKAVADLLAKSGCSGPRLAREVPTPVTDPTSDPTGTGSGSGSGSAAPIDESKRAEADSINEQGKEKLRSADVSGAIAAFQQANSVAPDPRYVFNICLALEAQEQWDNAIAACKQARGMSPPAKLATKIDARLDLLTHRK